MQEISLIDLPRSVGSPLLPSVLTGTGGLKSAWLQITSRCNQFCSYCYMNASRENTDRMSLEQIRSIYDVCKQLGAKVMLISGGEPTIVKELPTILRWSAQEYGFKTYLVTNGSGITDSLIELLRELDVYVQVSMDSIDDEAYARARGLPLLPRIKDNIVKMVAAGVGVALSVPVTNVVDTSVLGVLNWAVEQGIQNVHVSTSYSQRTGVTENLARQAPASVLSELYAYEKQHYDELSIDLIENILINMIGAGEPCSTYCTPMSGKTLEVDAQGNAFYCGAITTVPELALGSIYDHDFVERYRARGRENRHLSFTPDRLPECGTCEYELMCKGSCRSAALTYSGDLFAPVSHCLDLKLLYAEMVADYRAGRLDDVFDFLRFAYGEKMTAQTKCF